MFRVSFCSFPSKCGSSAARFECASCWCCELVSAPRCPRLMAVAKILPLGTSHMSPSYAALVTLRSISPLISPQRLQSLEVDKDWKIRLLFDLNAQGQSPPVQWFDRLKLHESEPLIVSRSFWSLSLPGWFWTLKGMQNYKKWYKAPGRCQSLESLVRMWEERGANFE